MEYSWQTAKELGWVVLVAAGTVLLQMLVDFDSAKIEDWETWGVGLGSGMIRAAAGAAIAFLTRPK